MKKKICMWLIMFAIMLTGVSFAGNTDLVYAEETGDSNDYKLYTEIQDEEGYQELWVGDRLQIAAGVYDQNGEAISNDQWIFISQLEEFKGSEFDLYYYYGSDIDHIDKKIEGDIPEEAFGKYVFAGVWVYVEPETMLYRYTQSAQPVKMAYDSFVISKLSANQAEVSCVFSSAASAKIPSTVTISGKKYKVSKISKNALQNNAKLKTITLGSNVTAIGESAFSGASKLTNVTISGNIKSIGKDAFKGINKKAVFKIKASKKNYEKIVKKIKKSGVPKTVKFKRI